MRPFSKFKGLATKVGEARRRRQTRIAVEALPPHLRKDIGWDL